MTNSDLRVLHVSPRVQAHGGIETLHTHHARLPGHQAFVSFFDRNPQLRERYYNLDATWRTPLAEMRRRFARIAALEPDSLVVYHNGWGLPLFHDLDRATRRVVFLHADPDYHLPEFPSWKGLVDGMAAVSPAVTEVWKNYFHGWASDRMTVCPLPIEEPASPARVGRKLGAPLVLGYAGRLERGQKRIDLLPSLLAALDVENVPFRFEVLGDGSWADRLRRQLGDRVLFHGWTDAPTYRRTLASWDAVIYFSENEGGPIALLEAMAAGVIPFYPVRGGSWADIYAPQIDPRCHYPPEDFRALARSLRELSAQSEESIQTLRAKTVALVQPHRGLNYRHLCEEFLVGITGQPRISSRRARAGKLSDALPLGFVARFASWALRRN